MMLNIEKVLKKSILFILFLSSLICFFLFYQLYWIWTFDSEGRAFDPVEGIVYQESSMVWGILGFSCLVASILVQRRKF